MKHFLTLLFFLGVVSFASAQCASCTPGLSACPPQGGLCNKSDTGMANQPYQSIIRFYLPSILRDPSLLAQCSGCSYIRLRKVKITSVTGLPSGISNYVFNQTQAPYKGYYNVETGDTLGCVSICGTPIAAGVYVISVNLVADVTAIGTPIGNVNQDNNNLTYTDTMVILPDTSGSVSSFTYGGIKEDCDSVRLNLNATLSNLSPNPTRYNWNLGNGTTSNLKTPGNAVTFKQPGTYKTSLQTIFYDYKITQFHINNMTNPSGWQGDIEELLSGDPEVYTVIGALGVNTSANFVSGTTNLNLPIPAASSVIPAGTTSLSFELWDKDNGPPLGSADDFLGTYTINISTFPILPYDVNFTGPHAQGYIRLDTVRSTVINDTLTVSIKGRPAKPIIMASADTICTGDSIRLVATPYCASCVYSWTLDDTISVFGVTDSAFYTLKSGKYKANVIDNITGCTNTGDSIKAIYFATAAPGFVGVSYFSATNVVFANPGVGPGFKARWFKDGLEIVGQTGTQLPFVGDGVYQVEVYNTIYPACNVFSDTVRVSTVGIENEILNSYNLSIYPNPAHSSVHLSLQTDAKLVNINMLDNLGRVVYTTSENVANNKIDKEIALTEVAKGVYTLLLNADGKRITRKVVVN